jgi:hypothetical protein
MIRTNGTNGTNGIARQFSGQWLNRNCGDSKQSTVIYNK